MASAIFAALAALLSAFIAVDLLPFLLELQSTQSPTTFDGTTLQVLLTLAAAAALYAAVAFIHLRNAGAAAAGAWNRRLSELVPFTLCFAVGTLVFSLFVLPPAGVVDGDVGALLARALGRAAVDALPASAAVVFFLGITLLIAHIRAGGEGGGGAAAADRRVPAPVGLLKKISLGAVLALLGQITMVVLYVK